MKMNFNKVLIYCYLLVFRNLIVTLEHNCYVTVLQMSVLNKEGNLIVTLEHKCYVTVLQMSVLNKEGNDRMFLLPE